MSSTRQFAPGTALSRVLTTATATPRVPLQVAAVRILTALTFVVLLLREWPNRATTWGPDAPWSYALSQEQLRIDGAFSLLVLHPGRFWFEACYVGAVLVGVLMVLGWHTRVVSALFLLAVVSFHNRSLFIADSGDLILQLSAIYLVLMRCGEAWSLDARRRARPGPVAAPRLARRLEPLGWAMAGGALVAVLTTRQSEPVIPVLALAVWAGVGLQWAARCRGSRAVRTLVECLANLFHNSGVALLMVQVVLIYSTAGWYKIQGRLWQQGTGAYYPLHVDTLSPWPALSGAVASSAVLVLAISYLTVLMQIAFPFAVLNQRAKKVLLVGLAAEHIGIAVLLGLPFFTGAILAADAIFLPTSWLVAVRRTSRHGRRRRVGAQSRQVTETSVPVTV